MKNDIVRKNPIKRNNMFLSKEDFDFEMNIGKDYIEEDVNQTVVLYQVDLEKTKINDIYKEANKNDIVFKTPVEIPVIYEIQDTELKQYEKAFQKGVYAKVGKLVFGVYESTLSDNECDIRRGDYIGIQVTPERMEFFTVIDDGRVNYSNSMSYYGVRPYYRKVQCAPVDKNEFNG